MFPRLFHLFVCLLLIGPITAPGWTTVRPENRPRAEAPLNGTKACVGGSPAFSSTFASPSASQVAEPHQENPACVYDFASGVRIYLYAHSNPVIHVDPSGNSIGSSIESVLVSAIQNGLQGFKNASTIIVKRQVVKKLASEVGEEIMAEGVYFLLFESPYGLVAYVGQSDDVLRRIGEWEDWAKKAGKHVSDYAVHVVGYVQVFTKDQTLDRTRKFIRELVEQGLLDMIRDDPLFQDNPDLIKNQNNPVRASTAVERFERHFKTPAMKKKFKQLFKKVFPL